MSDTLFGEDINFWIELRNQAMKKDIVDLIREIANLRAKVSFYESRIQQLGDFMESRKEIR